MAAPLKMATVLFPVWACLCWAFSYVTLEQSLTKISIPTWLALNALALVVAAFALSSDDQAISLNSIIVDRKTLVLVGVCLAATIGAEVFTIMAIKNVSATYAAFGEMMYPFFIPIFAYLIFGVKELNISTLVGGVMIMFGGFILVSGKLKGW